MLFPLSDGVWGMFFRGMVFGFSGGLVLILLFLWSSGTYGALAALRPIGFVYFGWPTDWHRLNWSDCVPWLQCLQGWGHHMVDQSKSGGASHHPGWRDVFGSQYPTYRPCD